MFSHLLFLSYVNVDGNYENFTSPWHPVESPLQSTRGEMIYSLFVYKKFDFETYQYLKLVE